MSSTPFIAARDTGPMSSLRVQGPSDSPADAPVHVGAPLDIGIGGGSGGGGHTAPPKPRGEGAVRAFFRRMASPFRGGGRADEPDDRRPGRSGWWFLLPIFLHMAGGIMAFFILRQDDARKARNCLYLGLALSALVFAPLIVLAALGVDGAID